MASHITPARLGFLAIYNPSLSSGAEEDALDDQIVYYASIETLSSRHRAQRRRRRRRGAHQRGRPAEDVSQEERNERLRQIGLAQGMVDFAGGFSGGEAVKAVETERSRVVVREVEPGWWLLSSVDLTRVPLPPKLPVMSAHSKTEEAFEYSSREMKPAPLLLQDLLRAHSLFLLHHGVSLSSLLSDFGRRRFVSTLTRYWDLFLSTWSVCLHGNPVRSVLGGINVAASGELGVGVGEEDRGSGEREVLEGLVGRIDGLVDVVVSKFAEANGDEDGDTEKNPSRAGPPWLGVGRDPGTEDGALFLGVGALSRRSLTDLTHWVEDLYTWGDNAYGVIGAPSYAREDLKGKKFIRKSSEEDANSLVLDPKTGGCPAKTDGPVGEESPTSNEDAAPKTAGESGNTPGGETQPEEAMKEDSQKQDEEGHMDRFMNVLKLGYGTYWSLGGGTDAPQQPAEHGTRDTKDKAPSKKPVDESEGYFLLGLQGTVEEHPLSDSDEDLSFGSPSAPPTHTRILQVRRSSSSATTSTRATDSDDSSPADAATPLRAVVYIIKPFIFAFLFRPETPSLSADTLYRSLHYQLSPLRKSLLLSTSYRPPRPVEPPSSVYDLVFDPGPNITHSTIPNIPVGDSGPWTRAEAAATHMHLLSLYAARKPRDVEATARTNRGWWAVWNRVAPTRGSAMPPTIAEEGEESDRQAAESGSAQAKEVFLLRRAGESRARAFSGSSLMGDGSGRLAQGIGVDTREYIENLLNLGR